MLLPAKEDPDEPLLCGESLCVKGGNNPVGALKYFEMCVYMLCLTFSPLGLNVPSGQNHHPVASYTSLINSESITLHWCKNRRPSFEPTVKKFANMCTMERAPIP